MSLQEGIKLMTELNGNNSHSNENPCGLDGFAFIEFSGPDKSLFTRLFAAMGFQITATHQTEDITSYQQGDIHFIVNATPATQAEEHGKIHGPGACAMGFRVHNAEQAFAYAIAHGATPFEDCKQAPHNLPAINAIGGSVIYFVDDKHQPFAGHWKDAPGKIANHSGAGLSMIDHLTHNVHRGNMDKWADFYATIFNFKQIRYFDIKGKITGLISRALGSPCGKIKIPLNESKDDRSQIEEFLHEFHGEGIQHIALATHNIYDSVHQLHENGMKFLDVPDTYYEMIEARLPWHQEPLQQLKQECILIDGDNDPKLGLLLQIFTENVFGPVFFEIIQRKGNDGFGEGNFQALFEAIERDQIRRGTL